MITTTHGLTVSDARVIVRALREQLEFYTTRGLNCISPPVLTSYYLSRKGFPQTHIRRFWHRIGGLIKYTIFEKNDIKIDIVLRHDKGVAYHDAESAIPLEDIVCRRYRECIVTSNTNVLYAFLEAQVAENMVRISLLKLLCLIESAEKGLGLELVDKTYSVFTGSTSSIKLLMETLEKLFKRFRPFMETINPLLPRSVEEALTGSKPLKTLVRLLLS